MGRGQQSSGLATVLCRSFERFKLVSEETDETMKHTEDFKREAVRIALSSGLSRTRVAADLGIGKSTLAKWIVDYRPDEPASGQQAGLVRENERLRRRIGFCGKRGKS